MAWRDILASISAAFQPALVRKVRDELARLNAMYNDSIKQLASGMNRRISEEPDAANKLKLIQSRNLQIKNLFNDVLTGMQSLKNEVSGSGLDLHDRNGQVQKLLGSIDSAHKEFMDTVRNYRVYNSYGELVPAVGQDFINSWETLRGPTQSVPSASRVLSEIQGNFDGTRDPLGKDVALPQTTDKEMAPVYSRQAETVLYNTLTDEELARLQNLTTLSADERAAVDAEIKKRADLKASREQERARIAAETAARAAALQEQAPSGVPPAASAEVPPVNTQAATTSGSANAGTANAQSGGTAYGALLASRVPGLINNVVNGLRQSGQSPEQDAIDQRINELNARRAEQISEADRAQGIYNRPEQVQAAVDTAAAQQAAASAARAEVGGAGGAGLAAQKGMEAAYMAGTQAYPQLLQNARQLRYQYEQEEIARRNAASETGADINAARQASISANQQWAQQIRSNQNRVNAQSGAPSDADNKVSMAADSELQAFIKSCVAAIEAGQGDAIIPGSGNHTDEEVTANWSAYVRRQANFQVFADSYGGDNVVRAVLDRVNKKKKTADTENRKVEQQQQDGLATAGQIPGLLPAQEPVVQETTAPTNTAPSADMTEEQAATAQPNTTADYAYRLANSTGSSTARKDWAAQEKVSPAMAAIVYKWTSGITGNNPTWLARFNAVPGARRYDKWLAILKAAKAGTLTERGVPSDERVKTIVKAKPASKADTVLSDEDMKMIQSVPLKGRWL